MENQGPLTDADFAEIQRQLENLKEAERQIEMAARAGVDVTQQREQAKEARAKLLQIRQTYFPGRI